MCFNILILPPVFAICQELRISFRIMNFIQLRLSPFRDLAAVFSVFEYFFLAYRQAPPA